MVTTDYDVSKPSVIRELLGADRRITLLLALVAQHNRNAAQGGVAYDHWKKEKERVLARGGCIRSDHTLQRLDAEYQKHRQLRPVLKSKINQLCRLMDLTAEQSMGSRVRKIHRRKKKGQGRPIGGFFHLSNAALFVFSDMFSEEEFLNVITNEVMFGDSP